MEQRQHGTGPVSRLPAGEGHLCHLCVCELSESLGTVESALGDCWEDGMIVPLRHLAHYYSKCSFSFPSPAMKTGMERYTAGVGTSSLKAM